MESMKYENYMTFDPLLFSMPYINETINITWEEWSCCSACCCSVALCGLYSNAKKCHEVDSYRQRRGFLSVLLLNPNKPLQLANKSVSQELDKILRVSPYRDNGIAIFSSLIHRTPRFRQHLWQDVLKYIVDDNLDMMPHDVGLFIEEQNCTEMPQKTNCSVLAECRGQVIHEPQPVEEQVIVDPCAKIPMTILSITESSASFRFETNMSYRLRLDGIDKKNLETISWKIGGKPIALYDPLKPCFEQGIVVHLNAFDLILIEPNETEVVGPLIEAFTSVQKFKIKFLTDKHVDELLDERSILVEKVGKIAACVITAIALFVLIHNFFRTKRITGIEQPKRKSGAVENGGGRKLDKKQV